MLIEADRRGLLTGERKAAFDEAVRRGLITLPQAQPASQQPAVSEPAPQAVQAPEVGSLWQFARRAAGGFVANMIGLPHAAGELLALGAALPQAAAEIARAGMRGEPLNVGERFAAAREEQRQSFPASALLQAPNPSATDVLAAWRTLAEVPGAVQRAMSSESTLGQELGAAADQARATEEQIEAAHPMSSFAGDLSADALTLLAGRPTVQSLLRKRTGQQAVPKELADDVESATAKIQRALGRTAEAGFEGAVIGALGDGDPLQTAAWSAGIQAGGSMALETSRVAWKRPLSTVGALTLGHEIYRAVAPGRQDLFESKDEAVRAMVGAYATGVIAALAGAGRGKDVRSFADAFSTISRGAIASFITSRQEADRRAEVGQEHYATVLDTVAQDPNFFGREARWRIEQAANSDKPNALLDTIDELMKSRRFRERLADLEAADD